MRFLLKLWELEIKCTKYGRIAEAAFGTGLRNHFMSHALSERSLFSKESIQLDYKSVTVYIKCFIFLVAINQNLPLIDAENF